MRRLYKEYFYIPKNEKIRDKVFFTRITFIIVSMIACLMAMSISAYAYFSANAYSITSTVKSAHYDLKVTPVEEVKVTDGVFTLDNSGSTQANVYRFNIEKSTESTATVGYCEISVKTDTDDAQSFYTKPIGAFKENEQPTTINQRTVLIEIPAGKKAYISFIPQWGSYSGTALDEANEKLTPSFAPNPPPAGSGKSEENSTPDATENQADTETLGDDATKQELSLKDNDSVQLESSSQNEEQILNSETDNNPEENQNSPNNDTQENTTQTETNTTNEQNKSDDHP